VFFFAAADAELKVATLSKLQQPKGFMAGKLKAPFMALNVSEAVMVRHGKCL
jgi:hypothetical protein